MEYYSFTNESALSFYRNLAGGMDPDDAYALAEGAVMERVKILNGKEAASINKEIRAFQKAKRKGNKAEAEKHRKEALKQLEDLKKKAKEIPDDTWVSYASRIAGGIALFGATIGITAKATAAGKAFKAAVSGGITGAGLGATTSAIVDIIAAKQNGDSLKEVSRKTCLRAIDQTITAVKSL